MLGRTRNLILLLILAVAVPIGVSKLRSLPSLSQSWSNWSWPNLFSSSSSSSPSADITAASLSEETKKARTEVGFDKIFRFDLTPAWVMKHWQRVSSSLRDGKLQGLRVAYVSGTSASDVAGALTFYFNAKQQLQRIYFEGYTGDANRLVGFIAKNYRLRAATSLGSGVFISGWNGGPTSLMRIRYAPVVEDRSPNTQQEITLELNRPGMGFGLSPRAKAVLKSA